MQHTCTYIHIYIHTYPKEFTSTGLSQKLREKTSYILMFDIVELGLSYVSRIDRSIYMQGERACDLASPDNSDRTSYAHVRKTRTCTAFYNSV